MPEVSASGLGHRAANPDVPHLISVGGKYRSEIFKTVHVVKLLVVASDLRFRLLQLFSLQLFCFSVCHCADKILCVRGKLAARLVYLSPAAVFAHQIAMLASPVVLPVLVESVGLEVVGD